MRSPVNQAIESYRWEGYFAYNPYREGTSNWKQFHDQLDEEYQKELTHREPVTGEPE